MDTKDDNYLLGDIFEILKATNHPRIINDGNYLFDIYNIGINIRIQV